VLSGCIVIELDRELLDLLLIDLITKVGRRVVFYYCQVLGNDFFISLRHQKRVSQ
jgi:hypothetical protein